MRKTTVYLSDEEADGLRRMAAATGASQAELIRDGVRRVLARRPKRRFHSLGRGTGSGEARPRWDATELGARRLGRR